MEFQQQLPLQWYCTESHRIAKEHGFWDGKELNCPHCGERSPVMPANNEYAIAAKIALIHSELSEALEAHRANNKGNFEEEIADTFIRLFDLLEYIGMGSTIEKKIQQKMEINEKRTYKHGKQL